MSIGVFQHLLGHAEIACRFPKIDTLLHQPGGGCVSKRVRYDLAVNPSKRNGPLPANFHRFYRPALPLDNVLCDYARAIAFGG
jgi:hypothetical protein